jgi:hypothetical protein
MTNSTTAYRGFGELHPKAKLSDREVAMLRSLREIEGWAYGKLVKAFEVPKATVVCLCKYRRR